MSGSVFRKLKNITEISGNKAQERKAGIIKELLVNCSQENEPRFLVRSLEGKLRIQLQHATLLQALAADKVIGTDAQKALCGIPLGIKDLFCCMHVVV
mgnify:CR=1 FL=1